MVSVIVKRLVPAEATLLMLTLVSAKIHCQEELFRAILHPRVV